MKTNLLIIIVGLSVVVIFGGLYTVNVIQNIENQKAMEEWRELRTFVMSDLGKQKKCEEMGGSWNGDHCMITQETFDSNKLTCDSGPVLEDATCQSNGIKLVFEPVVESKKTSGTFYPRIHISIFPDTESTQYVDPDFVTIGPGSQVTWSNYDDVPVSLNSVDPDNAWSTTVIPPDGYDTVTFEETGIYEYKGNEGIHGFIIVMDDDDSTRHVRGVYFSDWYDLDELYGLGCNQQILSHLSIYSNLLDEEFNGKYVMEEIGLSDGVSVEKFNECVDFIYEKRTLLSESVVTDSLKISNTERDAKIAAGYKLYPGVGWAHPDDLGNQQPIYMDNPDNPGELSLDIDAMQQVQEILDYCGPPKYQGFAYGLEYSNGTHIIDNNTCEWRKIK